jgi:AraC family transcriptional regulator
MDMNLVRRAIWYVESHSRESLTLDAIAGACGVSPYHLTRAFGEATGRSLMRYVRARRLSEAARQLALGAESILHVALDSGYGSHEAFSRAFRDHFGLTPEQLRARGTLDSLVLVEAMTMHSTPFAQLEAPRFETMKPTLLAGLVERHHCESPTGIPNQWQKFTPYLGHIPGQIGRTAYGACSHFDADGNFDYLSGVEVASGGNLPQGFKTLPLAEQKYAVFTHRGHIADIRSTIAAIWSKWLPESGYQPPEAPSLERYGPEFDPQTGMGGVEIWVPIKE